MPLIRQICLNYFNRKLTRRAASHQLQCKSQGYRSPQQFQRVVLMGEAMGLIGWESFGIRNGWNLSINENKARAFQIIHASDPPLVIGSPPCTKFSIIQGLNTCLHRIDPAWLKIFHEEVAKASGHIKLCAMYVATEWPERHSCFA